MVIVDQELARRLEGIETWCASEYARARRALWPGADSAAVSVAGGCACFLGEGSPLNEARGMGMAGPVSAEELEAMERVFFDRGAMAKVNVCPLADPSLLDGLASRGFRASGFEDVLYRELDPSEGFPGAPEGVALGWVGPVEGEVFGQTLARGFAAPEEPGPDMRDLFAMSRRVGGMDGLLARVDGEPAGAAMLLVRDGLAMLCGAATLPPYRNRGIQTALSHARMAHASEAGCGLALVGAEPGSTSHRNAERLGFRVAYTKLALLRDPAKGA
jgi:GNAT superfamily N-acetyltransferase